MIQNNLDSDPTKQPTQQPNTEKETGTSHEEEIRRTKREADEDFKEKTVTSDEPSKKEIEGTDSTGEEKTGKE